MAKTETWMPLFWIVARFSRGPTVETFLEVRLHIRNHHPDLFGLQYINLVFL